jgi:hypothetical protein
MRTQSGYWFSGFRGSEAKTQSSASAPVLLDCLVISDDSGARFGEKRLG